MILFPAIDLKDGACVRLLRGDMEAATVFNDSPADQALAFVEAGTSWLHMVDLNGAFDGESVNGTAVRAILDVTRAAGVQVQLGGGIRTRDHISAWLSDGIDRVILGTAAVKDPELVIESCREFPGRIAVGIDARGGRVAVEGWAETSDLAVEELARRFADVGVAAIIYTDIDGQPEAAPLFCPDYIIQLDSITLPAFELHLTARLIFQHQQTTKANAALYAKSRFNELVRAPLFLT